MAEIHPVLGFRRLFVLHQHPPAGLSDQYRGLALGRRGGAVERPVLMQKIARV